MDYEIKVLEPTLVNDYLHFFDTEEHSDNMAEHKCYCVCWCSDDHQKSIEQMSSATKRRTLAEKYVKEGFIQGYLAYDNHRVIGWCNTNERKKCEHCISWLRSMQDIPPSTSVKTKAVFCFAVAKEYRRKGIASALLKKVCDDAKKDGFSCVEAYPQKALKGIDDFEGPLRMYLKQGFIIDKDYGNYYIVKKRLS